MEIIYRFLVDFARPQQTDTLLLMQGDSKTRIARFILMNNGKDFDVSDVDAVTITALLPTEETITAEAELVVNEFEDVLNVIDFRIPPEITSDIGKTTLKITLYKEAEGSEEQQELNSFEFFINCRNELYQETDDDTEAITGLRDLLTQAAQAIERIEQMTALSALPNPEPLRIILDGSIFNYWGSSPITVDFGNVLTRLGNIEQAFPAGCRQIAAAVTSNGVPTSDTAAVNTIVNNIGQIRSDGNLTETKYAPSGKSWWAGKTKYNGTGADRGAVTLTPTGNNTATGAEGYYSQVVADGTQSYAAGRTQGRSDVTSSPGSYNLFTQAEYTEYGNTRYAAGRTQGRQDVTSSPSTYNLYTQAQYEANYAAGYAAGAGSMSQSRNIHLTGSMDTRGGGNTAEVATNCDVYIAVVATGSGIAINGVSGGIYSTGYAWVDNDYSEGGSGSFRPAAS